MNLFQTLHRVYVISWGVLVVAGVLWLYPRTGLSEPLADWYAVWQNTSDVSVKPVAEISGQVIKVTDGATFTLRTPDRLYYSVGLLGALLSSSPKPSPTEIEIAQRSKARLSELVLSNNVQVTLTWVDPERRGIGIVRLGETNVNAVMVESGLVQFKKKFIKGLPVLEQYALLRAERRAKEQTVGNSE